MKFKKDQYLNKWKSVFKVLPVKTEDGFTIWMERVYKMETDDILNPVRYHTDPLHSTLNELVNKVDEFLEGRIDLEQLEMTDEIREWSKPALTEGKMMHGNPPPPTTRPKRPPPPPAPPPPRYIDGRKPKGPENVSMGDSFFSFLKRAKDNNEMCPNCGTTDCTSEKKMKISSSGSISIKPSDLLQSCKVRQQLRAMDKIKFGGAGKKLPKHQPLGKYKTGSTGPK